MTAKKTPQPANAAHDTLKGKPEAAVADWLRQAKGVVPTLSEGQFLELAGSRKPVELTVTGELKLPALAAAAEALRAAATAAVEPYLAAGQAYLCEVRFHHKDEISIQFTSGRGGLDLTLHFPPVLPAATAAAAAEAKPAKKAAAKAGA